jgi:hypothetical protein
MGANEIRQLTLLTADGTQLEAEHALPEVASAVVVLAHPHPLHGGSMSAGLIDELFRRLPAAGVAAVRFNFRGVGASGGEHGGGEAEVGDLEAALAHGADLAGDLDVPVLLAGWSFGADVSLAVADMRHHGWVLVAPPLRLLPPQRWLAATDPRPKLVLVPEHDQYRPPAAASGITGPWAATVQHTISGADHFLFGSTAAVADHVVAFAADAG